MKLPNSGLNSPCPCCGTETKFPSNNCWLSIWHAVLSLDSNERILCPGPCLLEDLKLVPPQGCPSPWCEYFKEPKSHVHLKPLSILLDHVLVPPTQQYLLKLPQVYKPDCPGFVQICIYSCHVFFWQRRTEFSALNILLLWFITFKYSNI